MSFAALQDRLNAVALRRFGVQHMLDGQTVLGDFVAPGKRFTVSDVVFEADQPMLVVADGEMPADPVGKLAVCENVTYTVMDARPDGHGLSVLYLQQGL